MKITTLSILALATLSLPAAEKPASNEAQTKVHRLATPYRSPFDAFVYVNRIPDKAEPNEAPADFAGRIFGRLANQEGRIQLKLPAGMDRKAYLGFKAFLGSEGDAQVSNCVTCHAPPTFTDGKPHVVIKGTPAKITPALRNLNARNVDIQKVVSDKHAVSQKKRSGQADDLDDAYARIHLSSADVPNVVAFLNSLNDVGDAGFRDLIIEAQVLDTSKDVESQPGVSGVVRFEGTAPKRKRLQLTPESASLHQDGLFDEAVLVGQDRGLANVFVYVKKGVEKKGYPMPAGPAVLDQDKSVFRPRVQGVRVGQTVLTRNSDPFIHNVRSLSVKNRPFNIAQPPKTPDRERVFGRVEGPIRLGCDFHRWMTAYLFVMDHPFYAVTDENGRFKIEGLPVGEYTLEAWHEEFGDQRTAITVGASGAAEADFTFKPKAQ